MHYTLNPDPQTLNPKSAAGAGPDKRSISAALGTEFYRSYAIMSESAHNFIGGKANSSVIVPGTGPIPLACLYTDSLLINDRCDG
jgi:hypothetical protein